MYTAIPEDFMPWQPSTWPEPPNSYEDDFVITLERIIKETMLDEINNVITDATTVNGSLVHRGHVVLLALMCAIDSMAAYTFSDITGKGCQAVRYEKFISTYFPDEYKPYATDIYTLYRNSSVHSWNLFQAGIWPNNEKITMTDGTLSFGLLNFYSALTEAAENFMADLPNNVALQVNCLRRFSELKQTATP
jgi:hypothetical protein